MGIYRYKLASHNINAFLDWLFYLVRPNLANDIVRQSLLADHKLMLGNHIDDALPNKNKKT